MTELPRQLRGMLTPGAQVYSSVPRAEPGPQESCSGAGRVPLGQHLSPACSGPRDRVARPPVPPEQESCRPAGLALDRICGEGTLGNDIRGSLGRLPDWAEGWSGGPTGERQ